jgi:hypothetical protein
MLAEVGEALVVCRCTRCGIAESWCMLVGVQAIDTLCRLNIEGDSDLYIRKAFVIFEKTLWVPWFRET